MLTKLNFPAYSFRLKNSENKRSIYDVIRKRFIQLSPEEWVRQHVVHFLINEKKYPISLINVEKQFKVHQTLKRYDVVCFKPNGDIDIIVECKAPSIKIDQKTFDQIARYNLQLDADYLMVTNGMDHYFCQMDYVEEKYVFLRDIPEYSR